MKEISFYWHRPRHIFVRCKRANLTVLLVTYCIINLFSILDITSQLVLLFPRIKKGKRAKSWALKVQKRVLTLQKIIKVKNGEANCPLKDLLYVSLHLAFSFL